MQLKVLRSLEDINALENPWNALLEQSASHVPFLRHEYIRTWWETLGGGEWAHGDLFVVLGYEDDGRLAGIAPLFFTENLEGEPALMLVGSIEISDYLDLIVSPANLNAFAKALFDFLAGPQAPGWRVLDFYNIVETSPTLAALQQEAAAARLGLHPNSASALSIHPPARRLGKLPGRHRQKAAPRNSPKNSPRREPYPANALV